MEANEHLTDLQRYRDFRPTGFDSPGLHADSLEIGDWYVAPVMQTRDSDPLAESNFAQCLEALGGESDSVQVHRFGHWGPGWFEILVVDPKDATACQALAEISCSLSDYPILDEEDYSAREYERASEYWSHCGIRERMRWCAEYDVSIFAARRDEIPSDPRGELISRLAE
jgi:hypothetical protein